MPRAQRRGALHGPTILLALALLGACVVIVALLLAWPAKKDCPMTPIPEQHHAAPRGVWV